MYLKEIKMCGFKSFADKTCINLDDKITCIVGPNGSGKSNIVDAVKWVMGEQSIKSLRGDNFSSVIFSGSKSRGALNFASVTLIFDNTDAYLKIPYTDISVTRKVYKTGENEYFLNNESCRLKDIYNLFLDSGIGKEAYNIISQGEIGKIISDSPAERRIIFEETAGVLKYKKRKEEALRKLDKTNDSLNRVKDITTELEKELIPLKEESIKAKKHNEVKEKLENVEISLITYDLEKLNIKYKDEKKQIDDLQNILVELTASTSKNDITIDSKKEELAKVNENLSDLNSKLIDIIKEEQKINGEKNIIKERSKYNVKDQKIYDNVSNLKEEKLKVENSFISLEKDLAILAMEKEKNYNNLNHLKTDSTKLEMQKNDLIKKIIDNNSQYTNVEYKIKSLEEYINDYGTTSPSVKKVISNPKLTGIHNTIASLIETDEKYLLSLEVALGGAKDFVIIDKKEDAKNAIKYLKDNNFGRVTFFPLDVIKSKTIDKDTLELLLNSNGYINILANLVSYDKKYYNIVFNQLGTTILVDNLDNANYISKLINNRYRIVTLTGDLVNVGGSITGGSIRKNKTIISEKYELQNLHLQKETLEENIKKLEIDKSELEKSINKLNIEIKNQDEEYLNIENTFNLKNKIIIDFRNKNEEIEKELNSLSNLINDNFSEEEETVIKKYYDILSKREDFEKQIKVLNKIKEEKEQNIENLQVDYRINNSKIRDIENKLKDLEISLSKVDVKMDNLLNILTETYNMTYEKAKTNYILEMDYNLASKLVRDCRNELKNIGDVNLGSIKEYDRINTRYTFLTKQSMDLEKAIATLLAIIDELDKVMKEDFSKTFNKIQIEFSKTFKDLFGGGEATLKLNDPSNLLETGIDIVVSPPGKKLSTISLLSGGEKSLTAICLLFATLNIKKVPFCLFDEVEAALDESNVENFGKYLQKYRGKTQLLLITHKKRTMEYADTLYGITMQESGVSKLVSVKLIEN